MAKEEMSGRTRKIHAPIPLNGVTLQQARQAILMGMYYNKGLKLSYEGETPNYVTARRDYRGGIVVDGLICVTDGCERSRAERPSGEQPCTPRTGARWQRRRPSAPSELSSWTSSSGCGRSEIDRPAKLSSHRTLERDYEDERERSRGRTREL